MALGRVQPAQILGPFIELACGPSSTHGDARCRMSRNAVMVMGHGPGRLTADAGLLTDQQPIASAGVSS